MSKKSEANIKQKNKELFLNIPNISDFLEIWLNNDLLDGDELKVFKEYYSSYKNYFGKYIKYQYAQQIIELMEKISNFKKPTILEVGCGCGTESLWMVYKGANVMSIDINENRLNVAQKRLSIMEEALNKKLACKFGKISLLDLNGNDSSFDIIWLEQTFHHLEPRDLVFDKLSELVREGGYVIISETNAWNILLQLQLLKQRGFNTISEYIDENGQRHPYGVERILIPWRLSKEFKKRGIIKDSLRYFRILPNRQIADKMLELDKKMPKWVFPLFTHYNYVGRKA
jgi:2-polyprenyl-3-methyl-5-hydroxy-6-metoxy-1,4-benzoquinol methylase